MNEHLTTGPGFPPGPVVVSALADAGRWDEDRLDPDEEPALGLLLTDDRGSLPFLLVHGEPLVAAAAWALGEAGVLLVDASVSWDSVRGSGEPVVLHDSLCPLTPPGFLAACVRLALATDTVVAGVRPVTDTVKRVGPGGVVAETLDREQLLAVCSPLVLPPGVAATTPGPVTDLVELLGRLRAEHPVTTVVAPSAARRVGHADDVRLLEALGER